jgi:D-serine deaminase-like pyridoxal phosphate-dependent protein
MSADIVIGMHAADLPTPVLVVDAAVLRRNLAEMAAHTTALGVALRPHWKTTKSAEVARLQLAAGAVGHTVATVAELTALARDVSPSVFLAYPPVGSFRVAAVIEASRTAEVIVGADSLDAVRELSDAATAAGIVIPIRLDIDSGLHRTGMAPEAAVAMARAIATDPGLRLEGVWTHEGHVQAAGADPDERRRRGVHAGETLVAAAEAIRADGHEVTTVSVGSTPGVRSAPTVRGVTEARPGTYALGDENQVAIGTITPEQVAVSVHSRVVSTQPAEWAIIDAGIKAMSSDGTMHGDGRIGTVVSAGAGVVSTGHEEHGFLRGADDPRVGDIVRIRPNHACGAVNMHRRIVVVEDDVVTGLWPVLARH